MENAKAESDRSISRAGSMDQSYANAIDGGVGLATTYWIYGAVGGLVLASMIRNLTQGLVDFESDS